MPFQICPPSEVDGRDERNAVWASQPHPPGLTLREVADLDIAGVLELWIRLYATVHARWSPLASTAAAREIFGALLAESFAPELSAIGVRDGEPTTLAIVLRELDAPACVVVEALDPDATHARGDVAALMREVVQRTAAAGVAMVFDGHLSDPHYPQVLATVPRVTGAGLHLLQVG